MRRARAHPAASLLGLGVAVALLGLCGRSIESFTAGPAARGTSSGGTLVAPHAGLQTLAPASAGWPAAAAQAADATQFHAAPTAPGARPWGLLPLAGAAALMVAKTRRSAEAEPAEAPKPPARAPRIFAFDSMRFFLIMYIVCGHFIAFAKPSAFAFKAVTQINVVVGAFFALSGYVAAYTTTDLGAKKAKDKVTATPAPTFILSRVFGYWPLHLLVLVLFSPMFIYADNLYNGPIITALHGLMAVTMTQAWFPMHAEVWNAPTWFLGALTFATVLQPYFTPVLAKQGKKELRRTAFWLTIVSLLPKIGYCYDHGAWQFMEGAMTKMPNLAIFNTMRFSPFFAVMEVMLGFVACRLVMLDGAEGESPAPKVGPADTVLPLVGMIGIVLLRASGLVSLSDMIVRPCIFMPLFLLFLMGLHRASIKETITDPLAKLMASKPLVWLGGLSFPIFVVHGPLGQLFYKKAIATKLFGGTMLQLYGAKFFYAYLLIVAAAAFLLNKFFMSSKKVREVSGSVMKKVVQLV